MSENDKRDHERLITLAGGLAHDFNNFIAAILGNTQLALMETDPDSPAREDLEAVEAAARRAAQLSRQMLLYAGRREPEKKPVSLSAMLASLIDDLLQNAVDDAVITRSLAPDLPPVDIEEELISTAVCNIVANAVEAKREERKTTVEISCEREGERVVIRVKDDGVGMNAGSRPKIFDPYFSTKEFHKGLGLTQVLGAALSHGGEVKVYGEEGEGTTVELWLPIRG